jgi:transposase-like protein
MLRAALESEVTAYLAAKAQERLADGRPVFVRNGYHQERHIAVGAGLVPVTVPRTRTRGSEEDNFVSCIVPPYMRRSLKIDEAIPLLYLRGLSTGDMLPCLEKLLGSGVSGVSAANVSRLKSIWEEEYHTWKKRSLADKEYCYIWVDGIHLNVRLDDNNLCVLVVIGALKSGKKELIAVEPGYRESAESWATVLRNLKARKLKVAKLFIADGALGFWKAARDVYPTVRWQRCWVHKLANVLDKLPRSVQPQAKSMLHEIYNSPEKKIAEREFDKFLTVFGAKYPKATECLSKDREHLLTFYDFPAEHWKHIRSTNVIESSFSTVRLRTRKTRGQGTMTTALLMTYKLLEQASHRWNKLRGSNWIIKVIRGEKFQDGRLARLAA